jgi:hypothetical protein
VCIPPEGFIIYLKQSLAIFILTDVWNTNMDNFNTPYKLLMSYNHYANCKKKVQKFAFDLRSLDCTNRHKQNLRIHAKHVKQSLILKVMIRAGQ